MPYARPYIFLSKFCTVQQNKYRLLKLLHEVIVQILTRAR